MHAPRFKVPKGYRKPFGMEKIIHQIWLGWPMPKKETEYVALVKAKNPDFQHILWGNDNLPEMPPVLKKKFDDRCREKNYAFASDILRVYVVWLMGGVYLDTDMQTTGGFKGLPVDRLKGLFRYHRDNDLTIPNCLIGSVKGGPFITYCLDNILKPGTYSFGPNWLGEIARDYFKVPHNTKHHELGKLFAKEGIEYMFSYDDRKDGKDYFEKHFIHKLHYSWSNENKKKIESNNFCPS